MFFALRLHKLMLFVFRRIESRGQHGLDCTVAGFTFIYAISAYCHLSCIRLASVARCTRYNFM
jgi:hypothetical protein